MKPQYLAMVAVVVAALVGLAKAAESTRVYRQGNSTATITQDDGGSSTTKRRLIRRGPNSQTITQEQGGNRATIRQSVDEGDTEELEELEGDDW
jgi:hypothetical protein